MVVFVASMSFAITMFALVEMVLSVVVSGWIALVVLTSVHTAVFPTDYFLMRVGVALGIFCWFAIAALSLCFLVARPNKRTEYQDVHDGYLLVELGVWLAMAVGHAFGGLHLMYNWWYKRPCELLDHAEASAVLEQSMLVCAATVNDFAWMCFAPPREVPRRLFWWFNVVTPRILTILWFRYGVKKFMHKWLSGGDENTLTAAAVAALVAGDSSVDVLRMAKANFRYISCASLTRENFATNDSNSELYGLSAWSPLGFVDAFVSHSWHDDAEAKWRALQAWRQEFKAIHRREPRLWIDKFCIDQENIDVNLMCLPVYLAGCQMLVVFVGSTYFERLWCVMEVFVYLAMGRTWDSFTFRALDEGPTALGVHEQIESFNAVRAKCFKKSDKDRLLSIVASSFGDIKSFNNTLKSMLLRSSGVLKARATMSQGANSLPSASLYSEGCEAQHVAFYLKGPATSRRLGSNSDLASVEEDGELEDTSVPVYTIPSSGALGGALEVSEVGSDRRLNKAGSMPTLDAVEQEVPGSHSDAHAEHRQTITI